MLVFIQIKSEETKKLKVLRMHQAISEINVHRAGGRKKEVRASKIFEFKKKQKTKKTDHLPLVTKEGPQVSGP